MRQAAGGSSRGGIVKWVLGVLIVAALAFGASRLLGPKGPGRSTVPTSGQVDQTAVAALPALPALPESGRIDLSAASALPPYFASGWSEKAPAGVWSSGPVATLRLPAAAAAQDIPVVIDLSAFVPTSAVTQRVQVTSARQPVADWSFSIGNPGGPQLLLVPASLVKNGMVELDFAFPDATSPADQKVSADARKLAIFVKSIQVGGAALTVLAPGAKVDLSKQTVLPALFSSGWSGIAAGGVWNSDRSATLTLPVGHGAKNLKVAVDASSFLPNKDYVQLVDVTVGGQPVATWTFDSKTPAGVRTAEIPDTAVKNGVVTLELAFPSATSPAAQKLSGDQRQLGLFVKAISVTN